jgi:palmitoyltransferase
VRHTFFSSGRGAKSFVALSPFYTVLLPLRIVPYTDGRSWARRPGYITHQGIRQGEELTDEEADE